MNIINMLEKKAKENPSKIVFPESTEVDILLAAQKAVDAGICSPILVGNQREIEKTAHDHSIDLSQFTICSNSDETANSMYADQFYRQNQIFSIKKLNRLMKEPLYHAAMMVQLGFADAMIAGCQYSTAEVILASQCIIGLKENTSVASSIFLMNIPEFDGSEGNLIIISDAAVCENPTAQELADIAITTADTAHALLHWEPRVAMLSYSTLGSANSDLTKKVADALDIVLQKCPDLKTDGEMQLDTAIVPEVARKKVKRESEVAGKANILIVPDLNVGNILYKGIQRFAKADAYGPFLQGFKKTVSDLSRGSSVEDIYGIIILSVVQASQSNGQ